MNKGVIEVAMLVFAFVLLLLLYVAYKWGVDSILPRAWSVVTNAFNDSSNGAIDPAAVRETAALL